MAYVVSYAHRRSGRALQFAYTGAASTYCEFFDSVWIVPGTLTDD